MIDNFLKVVNSGNLEKITNKKIYSFIDLVDTIGETGSPTKSQKVTLNITAEILQSMIDNMQNRIKAAQDEKTRLETKQTALNTLIAQEL